MTRKTIAFLTISLLAILAAGCSAADNSPMSASKTIYAHVFPSDGNENKLPDTDTAKEPQPTPKTNANEYVEAGKTSEKADVTQTVMLIPTKGVEEINGTPKPAETPKPQHTPYSHETSNINTKSPITEKTPAPPKMPETPTKPSEMLTKAPEIPTKSSETPTKVPETPTKSSETPTKVPEISTKPPEIPTKPPEFDINYWVDFAKQYAVSVGLKLDETAIYNWDNPIRASADSKYLERDIKNRLDRYVRNPEFTDVWIWAERISTEDYNLYIGYA